MFLVEMFASIHKEANTREERGYKETSAGSEPPGQRTPSESKKDYQILSSKNIVNDKQTQLLNTQNAN